MRAELCQYIRDQSEILGPDSLIVEVRGRYANNVLRNLFPGHRYVIAQIGRDDVDIVSEWPHSELADCVICCGLLEHTFKVRATINGAARMLRRGGRLIVTCAGPMHELHSHVDDGSPRHQEFYQNVDPALVYLILAERDQANGRPNWSWFEVSLSPDSRDLFFSALKA